MNRKKVFISGGTGYIGKSIILCLLAKGHEVFALSRKGSEHKLPDGCNVIIGDALNAESFHDKIYPCDTFIQLTGVAHPGPGKENLFREIDLASVTASVKNAKEAGIKNFIYISVTNPSPFLKAYVDVRIEGERLIKESGMNGYIVRPWYVIGAGHYWPLILTPMYIIAGLIPSLKDKAIDFGLVKLDRVVKSLLYAVESPMPGIRIITMRQLKRT